MDKPAAARDALAQLWEGEDLCKFGCHLLVTPMGTSPIVAYPVSVSPEAASEAQAAGRGFDSSRPDYGFSFVPAIQLLVEGWHPGQPIYDTTKIDTMRLSVADPDHEVRFGSMPYNKPAYFLGRWEPKSKTPTN